MNLKTQSKGVKSFIEALDKEKLSPCHYSNVNLQYVKAQTDRSKSHIKMYAPSKFDMSFVTVAVRKTKNNPPPGTYTNLEKGQDYIYKGNVSPRHKR